MILLQSVNLLVSYRIKSYMLLIFAQISKGQKHAGLLKYDIESMDSALQDRKLPFPE